MTVFPGRIGGAVGLAAVLFAAAPAARGQITVHPPSPTPVINPWSGSPAFTQPPVMGYLPNGTPVVNPWVLGPVQAAQSVFAQQYALWSAARIWNPTLYPYWAAGGLNTPWGLNGTSPLMQPGAFGPGVQPAAPAGAAPVVSTFAAVPGLTFGPATQVEPGRFSRVGPDLAVNRVTGTVLRPYSGVAFTAEGPFVRLPGSGSFTPWGAYLPGTGVFVNPFTGAAYNPQTGLILR